MRVVIPLPGGIAMRDYSALVDGIQELLSLAVQMANVTVQFSGVSLGDPDDFIEPARLRRDLELRFAHYGSDGEFLIALLGVSAALATALATSAGIIIDKVRQYRRAGIEDMRDQVETERIQAETERLHAEAEKLRAETRALEHPQPLGQKERVAFRDALAEGFVGLSPEDQRRAFESLAERPHYQVIRFLAAQNPRIGLESSDGSSTGRPPSDGGAPSE